jgi:hypothetical protein
MTDPLHPYRAEPDVVFAERLERELLRRLARGATSEAGAAGDVETWRMTGIPTVPLIDVEPTRTRGPSRRRWPVVAAAAAVALVVGGLVRAERHDDSTGRRDPGTAVAADPGAAVAEDVARGFLDAYDAYDADRAITFLTDDAIAERWGSREEFPLHLALAEAQGYRETVGDCRRVGETAAGVAVRCPFEFHALGSDTLALGPYTDNYWELTVHGAMVSAARPVIPFRSNGFSREMWEPFADWVAAMYPGLVAKMYTDDSRTSPRVAQDSIALWTLTTRSYVSHVLSARGRDRLPALAGGMGLVGLPPDGATPTTPEGGALVDGEFFLTRLPYHYAGVARLYADGRLIWRMSLPDEVWSASTGWVELRLGPEDVERVAGHVVLGHGPGGAAPEMEAADFFGLLPSSAWDGQRPYVPSAYGACLGLIDARGHRIDTPTDRLLALLPGPAAALLTGRPAVPTLHPPEPGWNHCFSLPTYDARLLDRALREAGLAPDPRRNQHLVQYQLDHPQADGAVLQIRFEPQFPDGTISCSDCG